MTENSYTDKWDVMLKGDGGLWTVAGDPTVDTADNMIRFYDEASAEQVALFPIPAVQSVIRQKK